MNLERRAILLKLTEAGRTSVVSTLQENAGEWIEVFVEQSDTQGLWLLETLAHSPELASILLVKWEYIETLTFDVSLAEPKGPQIIGFR